MSELRTITASDMRNINRTAILDLVRREGPIARTDLAQRLKLSTPTVMRIVDDLIDERLVRETGNKEWSGGRRRALIEIDSASHLVVGVDMGGTKVYGAVADLSGKIYREIKISQHTTNGEESYQLLHRMCEQLLETARETNLNLLGIGVGVPGTVSIEDSSVMFASALDWINFPLKQRLVQDFQMPVIVDNDVNLSALGELWFGGHGAVENLVLITVGTGIGAGVILNGALHRGSHQAAGEIGFLPPDPAAFDRTYTGFGALEILASGTGMVERARAYLERQASADQHQQPTAEDICSAARRGEAWAAEVVKESVNYLTMAVAALAVCVDPQVVVLGGGVSLSADLLVEPIQRRLEGRLPAVPIVKASCLGYKAAVMGTIVNLVYHSSDFFVVKKLA